MHSPESPHRKGLDVYINLSTCLIGFTVYLTPCGRLYQPAIAATYLGVSNLWNGIWTGMEWWNGKTLLIYASVIHVTT